MIQLNILKTYNFTCVNAQGVKFAGLARDISITRNLTRNYHYSNERRRLRKVYSKERWIEDWLIALGLVKYTPRDIVEMMELPGDVTFTTSRWRENQIKLRVFRQRFHVVWGKLLQQNPNSGGEAFKRFMEKIQYFVELRDLARRFRQATKVLRMFVNEDFLEHLDKEPVISEKGMGLIIRLINTKNGRKLDKLTKKKFEYLQFMFHMPGVFKRHGGENAVLSQLVIQAAKQAQKAVLAIQNSKEPYMTLEQHGSWPWWYSIADLSRQLLPGVSVPYDPNKLTGSTIARLLHSRVNRVIKLSINLLEGFRNSYKYEISFTSNVKFIAEVGANGLNFGQMHVVNYGLYPEYKYRFVRPSIFGDVKLVEL